MSGPRGRISRGLLVAAAAVLLALGLPAPDVATAADPPPVPVPVLTVPPAGIRGHALWDSWFQLAPFGYEEQELFVSGTAVDAAGTPAPYTTRMIVTRPKDPTRFNGVVLLDWVNVTVQFENAVDTLQAQPMLLRDGYAYVHMSAQQAGLCCVPHFTAKMWDPVRYAAINHPGDPWAFDMVTQIAQAFREPQAPGGVDPMGALGVGRVRHVLAAGQSQSAIELYDYLEGWLPTHPSAVGIIDGVLLHGDVSKPKTFSQPLPVPVIKLLSDAEAVDDRVDPASLDPHLRLWEVAGSPHADYWNSYQAAHGYGARLLLDAPPIDPGSYAAVLDGAGNYGEQITPELATCFLGGTALPLHAATSAAIHQLARWADGGPAPNSGPRFQFAGGQLAKDQYGNTLGGIRLPPIDVPVASYLSTACALSGITVPFTDLQLQGLYGTHAEYERRMAAATDAAVAAGWILPEDALDLMSHACRARNRFPASDQPCLAYTPPPFFQPLSTATVGADASAATTAPAAPAGSATSAPARPGGRLPATGGAVPVGMAVVLLLLAAGGRRLLTR